MRVPALGRRAWAVALALFALNVFLWAGSFWWDLANRRAWLALADFLACLVCALGYLLALVGWVAAGYAAAVWKERR